MGFECLKNIIPPSLQPCKRHCAPPAFHFLLYRAQQPPLFARPIETEHKCHFSITEYKGKELFICTVLQTHSFHGLNGLLPSRLCLSFSLSRDLRDMKKHWEHRDIEIYLISRVQENTYHRFIAFSQWFLKFCFSFLRKILRQVSKCFQ